MQTVVILGGGAAGLMTAIQAKSSKNQVILLDRNTCCGKKILVTGNGRCNYWNENQDFNHYHSMAEAKLYSLLKQGYQQEVVHFFEQIGIVSKIKNGYYYPFSNQAVSIRDALLLEARKRGVEIKENFLVTKVEKSNQGFHLVSNDETVVADTLVLATGSMASPKTGSTGDGYLFAKQFGHHIVKVLPSLVQLKCQGNFLKEWAGIRTDVKLTLYENGCFIREEAGEIQLTDYGISGICTFNLSRFVARGLDSFKEETVVVSFLPFLGNDVQAGLTWLEQRNLSMSQRNLVELLEGVLNYKLIKALLKSISLDGTKRWDECTETEKRRLSTSLVAFSIPITGTNSFDKAQVCSGGVSLEEINMETMESLLEENLYLVGELLDVDGDCGGYNLGFAWMSGLVAGQSIRGRIDD